MIVFKILTDKPIAKRHLGRLKRRSEDDIRTNLKETGVSTRNYIDSAKI
jgi:hypothetical protein